MKKVIKRTILILFLIALVGLGVYFGPKFVLAMKYRSEAIRLVENSTVSTFKESKTTLVYDTNGEELTKLKNSKDLYYVEYKDIPETLGLAFVDVEDTDFYTHTGVDYKAIIRAIIANQKSNAVVQGASTITQQLARNTFLSQEVTWERKVKEMFIAHELEKKYTKKQILEFYLNNIYFSNGYYGVESAAQGYFSKHASELSLSQQAFIAAIPNGPSRYDPLVNFDNTLRRRDLVLGKMKEAGSITETEYRDALAEEIVLNPSEDVEINNYVVTYVRHCATESLMKHIGFNFRYSFNDEDDEAQYNEQYDVYYSTCQQMLLGGGYTIYTSIDMDKQQLLQDAVDNELASYTGKSKDGVYAMQGAAVSIDNNNGNVVAIVGGRSEDGLTGYRLNRAFQSYRQSGSAIKPLSVYTPYFQLGYTPDSIVRDDYIEGGPVNSDGGYYGSMTVKRAVMLSKNTVAWKVYQEVTPRVGCGFLMNMDFKKVWVDRDFVAASLGGFTYGVTTEEMAGAYACIANDGIFRKPTCVTGIADSSGKLIVDESSRGDRVYDLNATRMMTDCMTAVVEPGGTGYGGGVDGVAIAGKTGSTNSYKDMWFCGFSPYYTTACWIGYDYPEEIKGRNSATYIFKDYMTKIHAGLAYKAFPAYTTPDGVTKSPETNQTTTEAQTTTAATTKAATASTTAATTKATRQATTAAATTKAAETAAQEPTVRNNDGQLVDPDKDAANR